MPTAMESSPTSAPPVPPAERTIRAVFRMLAITFGVVGGIFLVCPDGTVRVINATGAWLHVFPPAPPSQLRFWLSLAVSFMALVTILAAMIQADVRCYRHLMPILAAGTFCSSFTCLLFFLFSGPFFLYLLNFLVDGAITVVVLGCYVWSGATLDASADEKWGARSAPILEVLVDTLFPAGGAFELGGRETPLARDMFQYFREVHSRGRLGLALLLRTLEYGPYLFGPRRTRFSRLRPEERESYLAGFEHSRFVLRRQLIASLKLIGTLHFYGYPAVQQALGYDGLYLRGKLLAGPNAVHHRARLQ